MSERAQYRFNIVAWVAVSITLCTTGIRGLWYLSRVTSVVERFGDDIKEIKDDVKSFKTEFKRDVETLKERQTRLEERAHVSGEFFDHTKGGNR